MRTAQNQHGVILLAVMALLLIIPISVVLMQERSSAASIVVSRMSQHMQLDYVLDAAAAHARYFSDQNETCQNFTDFPKTDFGTHVVEAQITQNPNVPHRLHMALTATLANGAIATRDIIHTAFQPTVTGTLLPGVDLSADSSLPDDNSTNSTVLTVHNDVSSQAYSLMHFNLPVAIPQESRIDSAQLQLHTASATFSGNLADIESLTGHALATRWSTDATWNTKDGNKFWRPGDVGEPLHAPLPLASWKGDPSTEISLDLTASLRRWSKNPTTAYGLLLKSSHQPMTLQFASRENSTADLRPRLIVQYACPCGKSCGIYPYREYYDTFTAHKHPVSTVRLCDPSQDYRGSDGEIRWTFDPWIEKNDDQDPCTGEIKLGKDSAAVDADDYKLEFNGDGSSIERHASMSDGQDVTVELNYRREGLTSIDQTLTLLVSNGAAWTTLHTIDGNGTDLAYQTLQIEVPQSLVGEETRVALVSANYSPAQRIFVADFKIRFLGNDPPPPYLPVVADTYIYEDKPEEIYSAENPLMLMDENGKYMRIFVRINTAGLMPGEIINQAKLRLWVEGNGTDRPAILSVYSVSEDWHNSQVNWANRVHDTTAWSAPGGSFTVPVDPALIPTQTLSAGQASLWAEFDITPHVQGWHDYPATNKGLILLMDDTGRGREIKFSSSEDELFTLRPRVSLVF